MAGWTPVTSTPGASLLFVIALGYRLAEPWLVISCNHGEDVH